MVHIIVFYYLYRRTCDGWMILFDALCKTFRLKILFYQCIILDFARKKSWLRSGFFLLRILPFLGFRIYLQISLFLSGWVKVYPGFAFQFFYGLLIIVYPLALFRRWLKIVLQLPKMWRRWASRSIYVKPDKSFHSVFLPFHYWHTFLAAYWQNTYGVSQYYHWWLCCENCCQAWNDGAMLQCQRQVYWLNYALLSRRIKLVN